VDAQDSQVGADRAGLDRGLDGYEVLTIPVGLTRRDPDSGWNQG